MDQKLSIYPKMAAVVFFCVMLCSQHIWASSVAFATTVNYDPLADRGNVDTNVYDFTNSLTAMRGLAITSTAKTVKVLNDCQVVSGKGRDMFVGTSPAEWNSFKQSGKAAALVNMAPCSEGSQNAFNVAQGLIAGNNSSANAPQSGTETGNIIATQRIWRDNNYAFDFIYMQNSSGYWVKVMDVARSVEVYPYTQLQLEVVHPNGGMDPGKVFNRWHVRLNSNPAYANGMDAAINPPIAGWAWQGFPLNNTFPQSDIDYTIGGGWVEVTPEPFISLPFYCPSGQNFVDLPNQALCTKNPTSATSDLPAPSTDADIITDFFGYINYMGTQNPNPLQRHAIIKHDSKGYWVKVTDQNENVVVDWTNNFKYTQDFGHPAWMLSNGVSLDPAFPEFFIWITAVRSTREPYIPPPQVQIGFYNTSGVYVGSLEVRPTTFYCPNGQTYNSNDGTCN